ncbi:MAG: hypothetical protein PF484_01225 [Bacteroidales bacterium]|jgi:hypothetical protein|nr:hypothetical protein [Bacteroidales bacterium]
MKKKLVFVSVLFIVAMLQFSFNDKSVSGFNVANGWSWDSEFISPSGLGQIPQSYWEEKVECTKYSYSGYDPIMIPTCIQWTTTRTERIRCIDNYVCPACTCQPI